MFTCLPIVLLSQCLPVLCGKLVWQICKTAVAFASLGRLNIQILPTCKNSGTRQYLCITHIYISYHILFFHAASRFGTKPPRSNTFFRVTSQSKVLLLLRAAVFTSRTRFLDFFCPSQVFQVFWTCLSIASFLDCCVHIRVLLSNIFFLFQYLPVLCGNPLWNNTT